MISYGTLTKGNSQVLRGICWKPRLWCDSVVCHLCFFLMKPHRCHLIIGSDNQQTSCTVGKVDFIFLLLLKRTDYTCHEIQQCLSSCTSFQCFGAENKKTFSMGSFKLEKLASLWLIQSLGKLSDTKSCDCFTHSNLISSMNLNQNSLGFCEATFIPVLSMRKHAAGVLGCGYSWCYCLISPLPMQFNSCCWSWVFCA